MGYEYHKVRDKRIPGLFKAQAKLEDKTGKGSKREPRAQDYDPYDLEYPVSDGWRRSKHRALVVIQHVSSGDLRGKRLLGDEITRVTYENVMRHAQEIAASYGCTDRWEFAFANFNFMKTYDLALGLQKSIRKTAAERMHRIINDLDPTLIVVVGDGAAEALTGQKDIKFKRGLIHSYVEGRKKSKAIPLVNTIDFDQAYSPPGDGDELSDEAVLRANILGYVCRNIAHGLIGRHPQDLSHLKPRYELITTIARFDWLLDTVLAKARRIAVDTEGTALTITENILQTVQFAVNERKSFIVPLMHKDAPWKPEELAHIKTRLKALFEQEMPQYDGPKTRMMIGQNFGYDLRMFMRWLSVRYCYWKIWDMQAAEHTLDENIKVLQKFGTGAYGLAQMLLSYGNPFYQEASFSKRDRTRIAEVPLNQEALEYMAMDAICMIAMQRAQMDRATHLGHTGARGANYGAAFHRQMLMQMSAMVKVMGVMRYRGTQIDVSYLLELLKPNSIIVGKLAELREEFFKDPDVRKADKLLRKESNIPTKSLFGAVSGKSDSVTHVLDMSKREHQTLLYDKVLKLEPLKVGKNGDPSYDKYFLAAYADEHPSLKISQELNVLKTLKSSFVDAYIKAIEASVESRVDQRLRPDFGYIDVVTGRSSSSKPNLQNVPEHSASAKIVKRMFITAPLHLGYAADYSAHEVRCWGIASGDKALATSLQNIHNLIITYRNKGKPLTVKIRNKLQAEADPHRQNYALFNDMEAGDVSPEQRHDAKGITFGSMYGQSDGSLAVAIKKPLEDAKRIIKKFFGKFWKGKEYLDWCVSYSKKNLFVTNMLGRHRNLFGYLSAHPAVVAAMGRLAQNSPTQGAASEICFIAADLFSQALHECLTTLGVAHDAAATRSTVECTHQPVGPNVMAHDSIKGEALVEFFMLHLHLMEWAMTNGVRGVLESVFEMRLNVGFDIEIEVGAAWALMNKWDWAPEGRAATKDKKFVELGTEGAEEFPTGLKDIIIQAVKDHKMIHASNKEVQAMDPDEVYKTAMAAYERQRRQLKLDKRYPLNTK